MQCGQDLAADCRVEHEVAGMIALVAQVGRHTGPITVHVHPEGGGGGVVGEPALQPDVLVEAQPAAAHVTGHGGEQVPRVPQGLEVFREERVLPVVGRGTLVEPGEHLVGEQARDIVVNGGHGSVAPFRGVLIAVMIGVLIAVVSAGGSGRVSDRCRAELLHGDDLVGRDAESCCGLAYGLGAGRFVQAIGLLLVGREEGVEPFDPDVVVDRPDSVMVETWPRRASRRSVAR